MVQSKVMSVSKSRYDRRPVNQYVLVPSPLGIKGVPEVEGTLRLTVSQSVCLGIEHPCGTCDQILFPVGMLLSATQKRLEYHCKALF
jgi:hypothetical protein